jgi:hypothetical protein
LGVAAEGNITLAPFNSVVACAPVNILITPVPEASGYTASLDAEAQVRLAITFRVENETLYIGTNRSFATSEPVKLNISLPSNALAAVQALGSWVVLSPGFQVQQLNLSAAGVAAVLATRVNVTQLIVTATG